MDSHTGKLADACQGIGRVADMHARDIIRKTTKADDTPSSRMRDAKAQLPGGVRAARRGELAQTVDLGILALPGRLRSLLSFEGVCL
jgi:hypothetical protein